jgi:hypothetical protein
MCDCCVALILETIIIIDKFSKIKKKITFECKKCMLKIYFFIKFSKSKILFVYQMSANIIMSANIKYLTQNINTISLLMKHNQKNVLTLFYQEGEN